MKYWARLAGVFFLLILPLFSFSQGIPLDSIHITGVEKTRKEVILRQLTIHTGDTLTEGNLEEVKRVNHNNIYNLGLFTIVKVDVKIISGKATMDIQVKERWYVWPSPYFALEERTFNEWWKDKDLDRAVYGMGLGWENFSGWNDRMYIYAQNGYSRRASFSFTRPFIFPKKKIDATVGFRYVNNKEIGYGTEKGVLQLVRLKEHRMRTSYEGYLEFGKRFSPRKLLYLTFQYFYFRPNDSIVYFNPDYMTNASNQDYYPSISLRYNNDQRDLASFPLSGYKFSASLRHSGIPGVLSSTIFTKASCSFSHYVPIGKRFNFSYGSQVQILLGDRVPWYDKFFIGFSTEFLRGYEPYVIDGTFINTTRAEWKYAIIPRHMVKIEKIPLRRFRDFPLGIYLSIFGDFGYVNDYSYNNMDDYLKDQPLLGYGAGINVITMYDFLLRVEYSRNLLNGGGIYLHTTVSIR